MANKGGHYALDFNLDFSKNGDILCFLSDVYFSMPLIKKLV